MAQAGQSPPQSMSASSPFFTPSLHSLNVYEFEVPEWDTIATGFPLSYVQSETVVVTVFDDPAVHIGIGHVMVVGDKGRVGISEFVITPDEPVSVKRHMY